MQNFNYDFFTNNIYWYQECGFENTNVLLWHTFDKKQWSLEELKQLPAWNSVDKIFLVGQEANNVNFVDDDERIYVWDNLIVGDKPRYHHYFWWFRQVDEVNHHTNFSKKLKNPLNHSPTFIFDCLMRGPRLHRDFVYEQITKNKLEHKIHTGYNKWIQGFDGKVNDAPGSIYATDLLGQVPYHDQQTSNVSTFLPYMAYNQCWFSLLTETRYNHCFFTEKTAKCLLGKRLFVFFGAQHALRDLRYMGYKTFDSIIDESYDQEPDDFVRWRMAWDQVEYLCNTDPVTVYQSILPVLEHNQKLFLSTKWDKNAMQQMKEIVQSNK